MSPDRLHNMSLVASLVTLLVTSAIACSGGAPEPAGSSQSSAIVGGIGIHLCPEIVDPVCGVPPGANYGVTYQNECYAERAGATSIVAGSCPAGGEPCDLGGAPDCTAGTVCICPPGTACTYPDGGSPIGFVCGTLPVTLASGLDSPTSIAVDATSVYWFETNPDIGNAELMKVPLGGGPSTALAADNNRGGPLAIEGGSAYWVDTWDNAVLGGAYVLSTVSKAPVDGSGGATGLTTSVDTGNGAYNIAVDAVNVYWAGGAVLSLPLAGGTVSTIATPPESGAKYVVVDGKSAYYDELPSGAPGESLMRVPLAGGAAVTLASGSYFVRSLAVSPAGLLWTTDNAVMSVPVAGGAVTTLASGQAEPTSLVADATSVYWITQSEIATVPLAGGAPTVPVTGQDNPWSLAVDATSIYWTNLGSTASNGSVMKFTPK